MQKFKKFFWKLVLMGVLLYVCAGARLYFNQANYIYHPTKEWDATPKKVGFEYEEVSFQSADGTKLSGWYVPAEKPRATILFCHGNSKNISNELAPLSMYHKLGYNFFLFDYRGFGQSEGKPAEAGVKQDAEAALSYLLNEKKIALKDIIIMGRSFGGGAAIPLAAHHKVKALIAEATFTSLASVGASQYPFFPVKQLLHDHYDSISFIGQVQSPVLVVHSRNDQLIPFAEGKALFTAAHEPKRFLEITGPHDNRNDLSSQALYYNGVVDFLNWLEKR